MKRYVEIRKERLYNELTDIGDRVKSVGGSYQWGTVGSEIVFDLYSHKSKGVVRVFTSLPVLGDSTRGCGKDAVRIVIGVELQGRFIPIARSKRVYRTAPNNVEDRVKAFLERLRVIIRKAYEEAFYVEQCLSCGSPMVYRKSKTGNPFLGCLNFPKCRETKRISR